MINPLGPDLDARTRRLLRTLISQYLVDGEPVGSRTLSRSSGLDVSPATIRNIMADLEDAGLVSSPHTSAGRVPTPRGLRLFVDSLIELQPLPHEQLARLQRELPPGPSPTSTNTLDMLGNASTLLSAMTHFAGVVTVPRQADFPLRHIDFVPLPDAREPMRATQPLSIDPLQDQLLAKYGIEVPIIPWPAFPKRLIRISAQLYNNAAQIQALATALRELLR